MQYGRGAHIKGVPQVFFPEDADVDGSIHAQPHLIAVCAYDFEDDLLTD